LPVLAAVLAAALRHEARDARWRHRLGDWPCPAEYWRTDLAGLVVAGDARLIHLLLPHRGPGLRQSPGNARHSRERSGRADVHHRFWNAAGAPSRRLDSRSDQ